MEYDKYITCMFPYPSGNGLHIGHFYNYAIMDSYCRYLKHIGQTVFMPFGYDAFGLPAENYARQVGGDPKTITYQNIEKFRAQMHRMNTGWEELVITSDPNYQFYTKKLFGELLEKNLAYEAQGEVDFCPGCETTLAREQAKNSQCDRCKTPVIKKTLTQWYFRITAYKQRLIDGLDKIDYPESTKAQQRAWLENLHDWCIGRQRKWGCAIPHPNTTDTMDTFVDSSFYTIIYCMVKGIKPRPVDLYVGGAEHACMHLIYARFIHMFLFDIGVIDFEEPFKKVIHQGMILNNGQKMSKSTGNVVNPDDYDAGELRFYLMFIGHYFDGGSWSDQNIKGVQRFIQKWQTWMASEPGNDCIEIEAFQKEIFNYTQSFKFNKVVSSFMIFLNKNKHLKISAADKTVLQNLLEIYIPKQ